MCLHPSVSLNNEKICCEISEDKRAVCEKTAGLRCGKFSDLNSACSKVLVPIKIFQFQFRFLGTFRGHGKRPTRLYDTMQDYTTLYYTILHYTTINTLDDYYTRLYKTKQDYATLYKTIRHYTTLCVSSMFSFVVELIVIYTLCV